MATFERKRMAVLAYAQGFTLWHYQAERVGDPSAGGFFDVMGSIEKSWFGPYAQRMQAGDRVMVSAADGAADYVVVAADAAGVRVMAMQKASFGMPAQEAAD